MQRLQAKIADLKGKGYKAYKSLEGEYHFPDYTLQIAHVQGDPFADPSRLRLRVDRGTAGLGTIDFTHPARHVALEDFLGRAVADAMAKIVRGNRGSGLSGSMSIDAVGQQVLKRTAIVVDAHGIEARIRLALPADGRSIRAEDAEAMLFEELPRIVEASLILANLDLSALARHLDSVEDQTALRAWLTTAGLVAFVADGSILPRRSGIDDRPLTENPVPFVAPDALACEALLPHAGRVRGLGIPQGVTLIVGGGFHGKSTLLHALQLGVYDHIPGDGRERVVSDPTAVKIRAEDGRAVSGVDISPFIDNLPLARDTQTFTTANASGSTSQAANIIEALSSGARLLLLDEDTSATNFMIRDARMQALVSKAQEPITPFVHRVRELYTGHGISTLLVMGGSSDYFSEADTIICMEAYQPQDATAAARALATPLAGPDLAQPLRPFAATGTRQIDPAPLDPACARRRFKIQAFALRGLRYGDAEIDLSGVEQLVNPGQVRAIGYLIRDYVTRIAPHQTDLMAGLREAMRDAEELGLDALQEYISGDLAMPRLHEFAAALNRFRPPPPSAAK
jgi:predicted ABC-class ATPase